MCLVMSKTSKMMETPELGLQPNKTIKVLPEDQVNKLFFHLKGNWIKS